MKDENIDLEKLAIKEYIKEYYQDEISEEELDALYEAISENYEISSKEEVFSILRNAEIEEEQEEIEDNIENEIDDTTVIEDEKEAAYIPAHSEETTIIKEEEPKQVEEKVKEEKPKKEKNKDKRKSKKKLIIIISSIVAALVIALVVVLLVMNNNKKEETSTKKATTKTTWKTILKSEAIDGTLKETLTDKIDDLKLRNYETELILMDIDSDETLELVAYVESENKSVSNKIITYEIDKKVEFSKDYDIENKEQLAYVYNMINENFYWYIPSSNKKVIASLTDKEVTDEEFGNNYYVVTTNYKKDEIFNNSIEVDLKEDSDDLTKQIDKVIKNKFTNDELLEDNNLDKKKVQAKIEEEKALEEAKLEEEQKKKEEEEAAKKKAEEEAKKKAAEEIVNYSGSDITLEVTINKMPTTTDGTTSNESSNYLYVKFSNSFITNNIVTSIQYLYANNKYNNANVNNIKNNQLRINDIYVNDTNETSVIVTFKDKDSQTKNYKITSVGQVVE